MNKKLLLPFFLLCAFSVNAQLNNSWIDYSKSYYKFKLGSDNICRIAQPVLASVGLSGTNADNYQLWKNGRQVRLFTSVNGAPLGTSDFIEFMGEMNDGKADKELYRQPQLQLADRYSLETDTAVYFLTVNAAGGNLRYASAANPSPGAATPDLFFMRSIDVYYRNLLNRGYARDLGKYVYSSSYDIGEGYTSGELNPGVSYTENITGLNVYTGGPANGLTVRGKFFGNSDNSTRTISLKLFNTQVYTDTKTNTIEFIANVPNLPLSYLQNTSNAPLTVTTSIPPSSTITDRVVISTLGITYPATFNFNNLKSFSFELAASATGNYLLIDNFNHGGVPPVLYDITNGLRYVGDISTPGKVKFVVPASSNPNRKFILNSVEPSNIRTVNALTPKTFIDYNTAATRADYVIISNPLLYNDGLGTNNVELYRAYRSSPNGGSYNAKIFDINELTDQFAFGIKKHPAAVRDFVRFMDVQYPVKPKSIFIIGRGMTHDDRQGQESNPLAASLDLVTTFGWPASDVLLVSQPGTSVPIIPVGRLGAINGTEVGYYLQKVMQYETAQRTPSPLIADKYWMKNALNITGGADAAENTQFNGFMDEYKAITDDTLFGGKTEKFNKTSVATVQQASSTRIADLFREGLGYIQYFGHSSATTFEFNLSSPEIYDNTGKYPFFNASGCTAGNYYTYDPLRLTNNNQTLSEKYIFANQKGSIGFLADTHFGIPFALHEYNLRFCKNFSLLMYGQNVGEQLKQVTSSLGGLNTGLDYYTRIHLEEINLHGDPAIKINSFPKADYVIEDQSVKINPTIITVADPSFNVKIEMKNIGRAVKESVRVYVKRLLPNATVPITIIDSLFPAAAIKNIDSLSFTLPINSSTDKGQNKLIVELDWTNRVNEIYETNNKITKDFFIFEDELRPVYPYNYSIINSQSVIYSASTANPLVPARNYVMEIDTTELFNSPFKKSYTNSGPGGVIQFTPGNITYTDSTVYYWRTAVVPTNGNYIWNNCSFIYLPNNTPGFNQSHYYQHLKNTYDDNIFLSPSRDFKFNSLNTELNISTGNFPPNDYQFTTVSLGAFLISGWGNAFNTLQFTVLDGVTGSVIKNSPAGLYGSNPPGPRPNQFEFRFGTTAERNIIKNFISLMPPNAIIIMYPLLYNGSANAYAPTWQADGAGSLYHVLKGYGFTQIDSFYRDIPMIFKFTKDGSSPSFQKVGLTTPEIITAQIPITISRVSGNFVSPLIGPAKSWLGFHWRGSSSDIPNKDSILFNIIGVTSSGTETVLYSVDSTMKDFNISAVNAANYPFLKLRMNNADTVKGTPYQLRYWRVNYTPVAEGAVAPNIKFTMRDTVEIGEAINFSLAFKNVSGYNFDNLMKISLKIKTYNNFDSIIAVPNGKILVAGDTLTVAYTIPSQNYPWNNTLFIEFNPNNDQPEQTHFNNVLYKDFFVKSDKFNPLLDVTFDGVHILSRDIVASKPNILIKLKDESRFLALKDTSLISVQLRYPDQSLHTYYFNSDTMRFIPANIAAGENTASIEFKPYLPEDGEYELIVTGKDASGNAAGNLSYSTVFSVINKPMISEMLNYPNPFTTSTAFVFTLTGSQVPQNLRIQVLTITGKIVREITKQELGNVHVGRNITDFKWDGTDMYGQKLANGVYIYRVLTNLNGKSLDKYKADGDNTSKYFNKGYGKMYLMR